MTLDDVVQQSGNLTPAGSAAVYVRVGNEPPQQFLSPFFQDTNEPKSLVLWLYNPSVRPLPFALFIAVNNVYIGPGEYKGDVDDIEVGLGIQLAGGQTGGQTLTWTASESTATDLTTYFVPGNALIGTFSVTGLVPGPLFGPPDDPPPASQPSAAITFCFFSSQVIP